MRAQPARYIAILAAAMVLSGAALTAPAFAQELSIADIVKALKPKAKVRAFNLEQAARESRQTELVNHLQRERTRQITVKERKEIAEVVQENRLPTIDLEVYFAADSAEITPEAAPLLEKLGVALNDPWLKGSVFLVAGHTDAKEAPEQNLSLSERRAQAVRGFLIDTFDIDAGRLVAVGFGAEQLKNENDPLAGENRRVQIVNIASRQAAKAGD